MELPSGGSMVMGGLLQDDVRQAITGLPGLKNLPVLGTLFRSRDFQRNETELVIIVTPYLVKPVGRAGARPARRRLQRRRATPHAILLGHLNSVYGGQGKPPRPAPIRAASASSSNERGPDRMELVPMTTDPSASDREAALACRRRAARRLGAAARACRLRHDSEHDVVGAVPDDYRIAHPIMIDERPADDGLPVGIDMPA